MDLDNRDELLLATVTVGLLVLAAFVVGFTASGCRTTVESTVDTTHTGDLQSPGDSVVVVVRGDGEFVDRVETRLENRLVDEGYGVAVARNIHGHQGRSLLVVDVERVAIDPGILRHCADLRVRSYYATDWNATAFDLYQKTGTVQPRVGGEAVVTGRYRITDRTRGASPRYRGRIADLVVDAVTDGFRGSVPR